jgi:hypothetical protein
MKGGCCGGPVTIGVDEYLWLDGGGVGIPGKYPWPPGLTVECGVFSKSLRRPVSVSSSSSRDSAGL